MADPLVLSPLPVSSPRPPHATHNGNDGSSTGTASSSAPSFAATLKEKIDHPASTKEVSAKEDSATETSADIATAGIIQQTNAVPAPPLPLTTDTTDPAALIAGWQALPGAIVPGEKPVTVATAAIQRTIDTVSPTRPEGSTPGVPTFTPASDIVAPSVAQATTSAAGQPTPAIVATVNDRQIAKLSAESVPSADKPVTTAAISAAPVADLPAIAQSDTAPLPIATTQPPVSGERTVNLNVAQPPAIASHPDQSGWASDLGQRLTWMIGQQRQQADLVLSPPHLGTLEISLKLDGNQASASFVSPHPAVREALDQALPRLREMLAEAGVTLGQTHVGAEQRQTAREAPAEFQRALIHPAPVATELQAAARAFSGSRGHGMVDIFA